VFLSEQVDDAANQIARGASLLGYLVIFKRRHTTACGGRGALSVPVPVVSVAEMLYPLRGFFVMRARSL
jgi:hypothetical protein